MRNQIIPYNKKLKELARKLRKQSTLSEVLLWMRIKGKSLGVEFHRQVPIDEFIVDFYCHEIKLAIEIDGSSHAHEGAYEKDLRRQERLESLGVVFIRFDDLEVKKDMDNVMRALFARVEELRILHPPNPLRRGNNTATQMQHPPNPLQRGNNTATTQSNEGNNSESAIQLQKENNTDDNNNIEPTPPLKGGGGM